MNLRSSKIILSTALLLALGATAVFSYYDSDDDIARSRADIRQQSFLQLRVDGKAVISWDTVLTTQKGEWQDAYPLIPSCQGRIATRFQEHDFERHFDLKSFQSALHHSVDSLQHIDNELKYYLRTHNINDEGYNQIADYALQVSNELHNVSRRQHIVDSLRKGQHVQLMQIYEYALQDSAHTPLQRKGANLLQTSDGVTPENRKAVHNWPFASHLFKHLKDTTRHHKQTQKEKMRSNPAPGFTGYASAYVDSTANYYLGQWKDGKREGFGFAVDPNGYLRVGEWKDDVFKGERLVYNSNRIYGIDISRHQHEVKTTKTYYHRGRRRKKAVIKKYPIDWSNLRITHLGTISKKKVNGKVDYPVSFIFIKATEGCTVSNNYFVADYKAAHQHNLRVGAYHFFSTTSSATQQAHYFLQAYNKAKSACRGIAVKKDLPPVLDVEPSNAQIAKMGGPEVLWRNIKTWLRIVSQSTGQKPILYINQMFVNRYLPMAPDIQNNYQVWIARYGEYKPYVHLIMWQLSPDGRVKGIHGDVDINLYNGYSL